MRKMKESKAHIYNNTWLYSSPNVGCVHGRRYNSLTMLKKKIHDALELFISLEGTTYGYNHKSANLRNKRRGVQFYQTPKNNSVLLEQSHVVLQALLPPHIGVRSLHLTPHFETKKKIRCLHAQEPRSKKRHDNISDIYVVLGAIFYQDNLFKMPFFFIENGNWMPPTMW